MELIESAVKSLRSLKALLPAKERFERRQAFALCRNEEVADIIRSHELEISTLASVSAMKILYGNDAAPAGCLVDVVNENVSVYLELKGTINAELEREKLRKKMEETTSGDCHGQLTDKKRLLERWWRLSVTKRRLSFIFMKRMWQSWPNLRKRFYHLRKPSNTLNVNSSTPKPSNTSESE